MKTTVIVALLTSLLAHVAWAQSDANPSLNLKLPANYASTAKPAPAPAPAPTASAQPNPSAITINGARPANAPGVYYGDTSGRPGNQVAGVPVCDDSTYNKTQVHGDVGVGVVSGSRLGTGSYQSGDVSMVKNLGSCDHPGGSVGISIGVGRFGGLH